MNVYHFKQIHCIAVSCCFLRNPIGMMCHLEVLHHGLGPGHAVVLGVELGDLLLPLLPRQLVLAHHHRGEEVVSAEVASCVNLRRMNGKLLMNSFTPLLIPPSHSCHILPGLQRKRAKQPSLQDNESIH